MTAFACSDLNTKLLPRVSLSLSLPLAIVCFRGGGTSSSFQDNALSTIDWVESGKDIVLSIDDWSKQMLQTKLWDPPGTKLYVCNYVVVLSFEISSPLALK